MKYLIIAILLTSACALQSNANDKVIDTFGYRYYHDMDNESGGSKLRLYVGKQFYNNSKLKLAYERKRSGKGLEAGTFFIDHAIKF